MKKQKLVLIGNGMAGMHCIESILREDAEAFDITIFGTEPHGNYSRIMLSSVLQGGMDFEDIVINQYSWYEQQGIHLFTNETVTKIDKENKLVKTDKLRSVRYDKLIIATGSSPFILPLPGIEKEGVISFRTIEDCQKMIKTAQTHKKAVVIGGGLLGLEAAKGLLNLGMTVDVVHLSPFLMERQLDETASKMLQFELENQGMNFFLEKVTEEIIGDERVKGIRFKDGTEISTDLIVMAVGVRPNIQLAADSGIETNRGIVVNDFLATNANEIYALGECAEHQGMVYGLVKPLYEQGETLARHLTEKKPEGYIGSILSTQLKISGVDVFSVGQIASDEMTKSIQYQNEIEAVYKKVLFRGDKAVGAVLIGDIREGPKLFDTIVKKKVIADSDKSALIESVDPADSFVATLPVEEHICTCNSVSKGTIIHTIQEKNLSTAEEVKACTKASSSCGGCRPAVSALLEYVQSDSFDEGVKQKTLCSCTSLKDEDIVEQIQIKGLSSVQEIRSEFGWSNIDGCNVCTPALEYYLEMIYPQYESRNSSLFLSEKMNAIIEKDGTYTVVPQLYGGRLTTEQLQRITSVTRKYRLENVTVASDQRIHLMGVKKEDLSNIWADLDMPLRSLDGNMVETIKTSVGQHHCQCDTQSSIDIAEELEQKTEHLRTPYRIKIGISSCLHNKAGSTTKDIGAIKVNKGWEIYAGGSSGRNVRAGKLLCTVNTDKETVEFISAFIQYYRESANYEERTWQWMERMDLIHIREVLFDEGLREELLNHLDNDLLQKKTFLINS